MRGRTCENEPLWSVVVRLEPRAPAVHQPARRLPGLDGRPVPATDDHQSVHLDYLYPDAERDLNRWLPLVKWLLAFPHYVVLFFLDIAAFVVVIVAWFAILFTGSYPGGMFGFVAGAIRWNIRVTVYTLALLTDRYPPFRLAPRIRHAGRPAVP